MRKKCFIRVLVLLLSVSSCIVTAWAGADGTTSWAEAKEIYNIIKVIALPLGAVGMAICAIKMFFGGDDSAQKAKKTLIIIASAMAAILLLPIAVKAGTDIGAKNKWDPKNPVSCIAQEEKECLPVIAMESRDTFTKGGEELNV